jgi:hypothetical protein
VDFCLKKTANSPIKKSSKQQHKKEDTTAAATQPHTPVASTKPNKTNPKTQQKTKHPA